MNSKKNRIPPDWGGFGFMLFAITVAVYFLQNGIKSNLPRYNFSWLHVILFVFIAVTAARGYTPDDKGIRVDILGIPVKTIPWYRIWDIHVIRRKRLGRLETLMILTLSGCDFFRPGKDDLDNYLSKHPFKAISITLPPHRAEMYTEVFRSYYEKIKEVDL